MWNQCTFNLIAFINTLLLTTIFFGQNKNNKTSNIIYKNLIYTEIYATVTDFILYFIVTYFGNIPALCTLVVKIHWISGYFIFICVYLYVMANCDINPYIPVKELVKKKRFLLILIPGIISLVAFIITPADYADANGIVSFFPGKVFYPILAFAIYIMFYCFGYIFKNERNNKNLTKIITIMIIEITAITAIQIIVPTIALISIGVLSMIFTMYLLIENPDLYIIKDLEQLSEKIQKSKNAKTDILSNMSVEISNPINNISEIVNEIDSKSINVSESKKLSKEILNNGNNLIEIIEHIIDLSRIETGTETLTEGEYSLANIIADVNNNFEYIINKKNIAFKLKIAPNTPSKLFGDSLKIKQIITNVLSNAIKYTDYGMVSLELNCDSAGSFTTLHFKISDTGNGIKDDLKNSVFSTASNENSTGLGLAITKKFVEQLNGSIKFDSTYLAGTVFYINIPQDIVDGSPINLNQTSTPTEIIYKNYNRQRIVIVDEDRLNRKVLIELLKDYNFDIVECESGMEVLNSIKQGNIYDLILIDHQMAGLDGIDVLNALNVLKKYFTIPPVIMTTANAQSGRREFYISAGFDDYLSKPISAQALNKAILRYVKIKDERGYEVSEMNFDNKETKTDNLDKDDNESGLHNIKEEFKPTYEEFIPSQVELTELSQDIKVKDPSEKSEE